MSLLKQDTIKKKQVDNALQELEKDLEFEAGGNKEYEVKVIIDSMVYGQQVNGNNQMLDLYYLILWKSYLEEKNIWELLSTVIHFRKLISTFHKQHLEKPTATSPSLNFAPLMAKSLVPKEPK